MKTIELAAIIFLLASPGMGQPVSGSETRSAQESGSPIPQELWEGGFFSQKANGKSLEEADRKEVRVLVLRYTESLMEPGHEPIYRRLNEVSGQQIEEEFRGFWTGEVEIQPLDDEDRKKGISRKVATQLYADQRRVRLKGGSGEWSEWGSTGDLRAIDPLRLQKNGLGLSIWFDSTGEFRSGSVVSAKEREDRRILARKDAELAELKAKIAANNSRIEAAKTGMARRLVALDQRETLLDQREALLNEREQRVAFRESKFKDDEPLSAGGDPSTDGSPASLPVGMMKK